MENCFLVYPPITKGNGRCLFCCLELIYDAHELGLPLLHFVKRVFVYGLELLIPQVLLNDVVADLLKLLLVQADALILLLQLVLPLGLQFEDAQLSLPQLSHERLYVLHLIGFNAVFLLPHLALPN